MYKRQAYETPVTLEAQGAVWEVDASLDGSWRCASYKTAEQNESSGIVSGGTRRKLSIVWSQAMVKFYLDDSLKRTEFAQAPNIPCGIYMGIKTTTIAAKALNIEMVRVRCYTV